jgi:prophage maintenance system killer protein
LELNGYQVVAEPADSAITYLALAAGELEEAAPSAWLKANAEIATP